MFLLFYLSRKLQYLSTYKTKACKPLIYTLLNFNFVTTAGF